MQRDIPDSRSFFWITCRHRASFRHVVDWTRNLKRNSNSRIKSLDHSSRMRKKLFLLVQVGYRAYRNVIWKNEAVNNFSLLTEKFQALWNFNKILAGLKEARESLEEIEWKQRKKFHQDFD